MKWFQDFFSFYTVLSILTRDWAVLLELVLIPLLFFGARWISLRPAGAFFSRPFPKWVFPAFILFSSIVVSWLLFLWLNPPLNSHDEFSNLLMADTFRHGRLTNPRHPFWEHFETFHILAAPTYQSKFPVGQGAVLALGQILGEPRIGVWISLGVACLSLYWMFLAWESEPLALLGTLIMGSRIVFSEFSQRLFGGAIAVAGGALVLGAILRALPRIRNSVALGLGGVLLAVSRPFEGGVLFVLASAWGVWSGIQKHWTVKHWIRAIAPAGVLLGSYLGFQLYYNKAVTGHLLMFPYALWDSQYMFSPVLLWQPAPHPQFHHAAMENLQRFVTDTVLRPTWQLASFRNFLVATTFKVFSLWKNFIGVALLPFFLLGAIAIKRKRGGWPIAILLGCFLALLSITYLLPHYIAPLVGLIALFILEGYLFLSPRRPRLAQSLLLAALISVPVTFSIPDRHLIEGQVDRENNIQKIKDYVAGISGKKLIFVRYNDMPRTKEWVFNEASIDDSQTVWARYMGDKEDDPLRKYYPDRSQWLLDINSSWSPEKGLAETMELTKLVTEPSAQVN